MLKIFNRWRWSSLFGVRTNTLVQLLTPLLNAIKLHPKALLSILLIPMLITVVDLSLVNYVGEFLRNILETQSLIISNQVILGAGKLLTIILMSSFLKTLFLVRFYKDLRTISTKLSQMVLSQIFVVDRNPHATLNDDRTLSLVDFDLNSYVSNYLPCGAMFVSQAFILSLAFCYILATWDPWIIATILACAPIVFLIMRFTSSQLKKFGQAVSDSNADALSHLKNYLSSRREIFFYSCYDKVESEYASSVASLRKYQNSSLCLAQSQRYILEIALGILLFLPLTWLYVGQTGNLGVIPLAASALVLFQRFAPVGNQVLMNFSKIVAFAPSAIKVEKFLQNSLQGRPSSSSRVVIKAEPPEINVRDLLLFDEGEKTGSRKKINFDFKIGVLNGISGPSGCGKSTLLDVIGGYKIAPVGNITVSIGEFESDGPLLIPQIPYIQSSTVRENVSFPHSPSFFEEDAIDIALRKAGFSGEQITENFKQFKIINNGDNLSVGMRMRISIARGLLHRRPIMLFDEPTAGLDKESARIVISTLLELKDEVLVIVASHDFAISSQFGKELAL